VGARRLIGSLPLLALVILPARSPEQTAQSRPGAPADTSTCPTAQPIKGNFTDLLPRTVHLPPAGGEFYSRTKPEQCHATSYAVPSRGQNLFVERLIGS
jgi:hypothetical protein